MINNGKKNTPPLCSSCNRHDCFIKLCSNSFRYIAEQCKTSSIYKKGQVIFHEDSRVDGIYLIYSGKVKVCNSGYNNKNQIVRISGAGDILGHRGFGEDHYSISAVALVDSLICFLDNQTFSDILKNNFELVYQLMLFYAKELRNAEARMRNLSQMMVREKVIEALLLILEFHRSSAQDEPELIDSSFSRQDIADIAGLSTEQVTKVFSSLKNEGLIKIQGKSITVPNPLLLSEQIALYRS